MDVDGDESPNEFRDEMVADENILDGEYSENLLSDDMDEPGTPVEQYESHPRKPLKNIKQGKARPEPKLR